MKLKGFINKERAGGENIPNEAVGLGLAGWYSIIYLKVIIY